MDRAPELHPETPVFDDRMLDVGDGHRLHVRQLGRADGMPAIYLHGGPGSGCQPMHGRLFDPGRFRVVLLDQRGSGDSTPSGGLAANTTAHLIEDLERVRVALGIERWLVVGGSWGATLAVAYAEAYPLRVLGLVLRAVFLGTRDDVDWAFVKGPRIFYPELWRGFIGALPAGERADPLPAYGARLESGDPQLRHAAACIWSDYEMALARLAPPSLALPSGFNDPALAARATPRTPAVEWHYFKHGCFLPEAALLENAGALAAIPGIIVQGRYDLLCPPCIADALAQAWPRAELRLAPASGHLLSEPAILSGVLEAVDRLGRSIGAGR